MSDAAAPSISVLDAIHSTRAMRRLKPDPVPDHLIEQVLQAGLCAANGGNRQNWGFIVVRDKQLKQQVQHYYQRAFDEIIDPHYSNSPPPPGMDAARYQRQHTAVAHLTAHFHEAPVWIVACLDSRPNKPNRGSGASIYPAVQNMLLACRALGLGATLTTRHMFYATDVDQLFGLPEGVDSYAIIPIGYPLGKFGPVRRDQRAAVHLEQWGNQAP